MMYTSFVVITDTPGQLATLLSSLNILTRVTDPNSGQSYYKGVLPGMEWVQVPNPILTNASTSNPIYDSRRVYLVKFTHESEDNEESVLPSTDEATLSSSGAIIGYTQFGNRRFGQWVKNNSTVVTAPASWTINDQPADGDVYKVTSTAFNVWVVRDRPERFGVWQ